MPVSKLKEMQQGNIAHTATPLSISDESRTSYFSFFSNSIDPWTNRESLRPLTGQRVKPSPPSDRHLLPIYFLKAIQQKEYHQVCKMLVNSPKLANLSRPYKTPLQVAVVDYPCDEIATVLIDAGAVVPNGFQLFYLACQSGLVKTVERLIKKGLDFELSTKGVRGYTSLQATLMMESDETHSQRLKTARVLIDAAPKMIDIPDKEGCTALHIASKLGDCSFINLLLDNQANPELLDAYGYSALALAIHCGQFEAAELLARRGASLEPLPNAHYIHNNLAADPSNPHLQYLYNLLQKPGMAKVSKN